MSMMDLERPFLERVLLRCGEGTVPTLGTLGPKTTMRTRPFDFKKISVSPIK